MQDKNFTHGILYALSAYLMWGVITPVYFKWVAHVPALEVLMHRVVWSFLLMLVIVLVARKLGEALALLTQPKVLLRLAGASFLMALNWLIYIWAISESKMLEASLGYFINPLITVLLGMLFLGERPPRVQLFAVALAMIGVLVQLVLFGSLPWVSLALAFSFGFYGLMKKRLAMGAIVGLFVETALLMPAALLYWASLDNPNFSFSAGEDNLLLMAAGLVTSLPLLAFAASTGRIPLYMNGLLQYVGPSFIFVIAVLVYQEPLDDGKLLTFGFIWAALVVFAGDVLRRSRKPRRMAG